MSTAMDLSLADLRAERRRLTEAVARLGWLRRLVTARADLEVARLTGVTTDLALDPSLHELLGVQGPCGAELLRALSNAGRALDDETTREQDRLDALTDELVARLASDPSRCLVV